MEAGHTYGEDTYCIKVNTKLPVSEDHDRRQDHLDVCVYWLLSCVEMGE